MKYKVLKDRSFNGTTYAKVGDIVYSVRGSDYGLARDDEAITGIPHRSVTLNENGDYPSFTMPTTDLEVIKD